MADDNTPRPPGLGLLGRTQIEGIIPHRDPFLLPDRILDYQPGEWAIGEIVVTPNMFWARGHFPKYPVMPGVLIVEALAQCGAVALLSLSDNEGKLAFFAGIDKVRFKAQAVPGSILRLECTIGKTRGPIGFGEATAYVTYGDSVAADVIPKTKPVEGKGFVAVSGELMFAIK